MDNIVHIIIDEQALEDFVGLRGEFVEKYSDAFFLKEKDKNFKKGTIIAALRREDGLLVCIEDYKELFINTVYKFSESLHGSSSK